MTGKKRIYTILVIILAVIAGFIIWGTKQPGKVIAPTSEIVYYYSEQCSHCKNVAKFLEENNIAEKVNFTRKEVRGSEDSASELQARAGECGIDSKSIGVPFLYARGECYIGDQDVIEFFKKEAGLQ